MNKILLIDGNSLSYRAYYGSAYGPTGILTNSQGTPINAILTLARMINKIIKEYEPTHIFVAFDAGKHTNRHDKLPSYKAGRSKTPEELIAQMPLIKNMFEKMGIPHYEIAGIEADDIVGTLSTNLSKENNVFIVSSDKDLYQLVDNDNVTMIVPQNGAKPNKLIEFKSFKDELGYLPLQVPDLKGIVGDPSDNLKGVEGIGAKGAADLLEKFDSLENIYENLDSLTEKKREKLLKSKEMAFLCKEIATIQRDVEVPFSLSQMLYKNNTKNELIMFFKELEINSLVRYYESLMSEENSTPESELKNIIL